MRLILNEETLLQKILNEDYIDEKKPSNTIKILAKHYFLNGKKRGQIIKLIDEFLSVNKVGYNSVRWRKVIEGIVDLVRKNKDYEVVNITIQITKNEINKIKSYNNLKYEKLLFVLLVYAKIYNQLNKNEKNWVNEQHKYIFSDAKIAIKSDEQGKMLYKLRKDELIDISNRVDCTNLKINYIDNDDNSEVVIEISDFRNLVFEYLRYFEPDKYMRCEECGLLIKTTNNKTKYCSECARKIHNEIKLNTWHKNKEKYRIARQIENPPNTHG